MKLKKINIAESITWIRLIKGVCIKLTPNIPELKIVDYLLTEQREKQAQTYLVVIFFNRSGIISYILFLSLRARSGEKRYK